jgi:hypothetical protein
MGISPMRRDATPPVGVEAGVEVVAVFAAAVEEI